MASYKQILIKMDIFTPHSDSSAISRKVDTLGELHLKP